LPGEPCPDSGKKPRRCLSYGQAHGHVAMPARSLIITKASVCVGHTKHAVHRPLATGAQEGLVICLPGADEIAGVSTGVAHPGGGVADRGHALPFAAGECHGVGVVPGLTRCSEIASGEGRVYLADGRIPRIGTSGSAEADRASQGQYATRYCQGNVLESDGSDHC
jgi:hypothetical protein